MNIPKKFLSTLFAVGVLFFVVNSSTAHAAVEWYTQQSAVALCAANLSTIQVTFKNTEPGGGYYNAMNVVAKDLQSGQSVNLGTVMPGATKTGTINTNIADIAAGTVTFSLTWSNGRSGTDVKTATYVGISCHPTAAELGSFSGVAKSPNKVVLNWDTLNELSIVGFNVSRQVKKTDGSFGAWTQLNSNLIPATQVGSIMGADYKYVDTTVKASKVYKYKVQVMGVTGDSIEYDNVVKVTTPAQ